MHPDSSHPRCWRAGKRGRLSTPGRSSGPRRRLRVETAISRRCSTTIAACPRVATRCGRCCITSIVGLQTGRHRRRGFSGGRFPICLRACCHRSTSCPCPGNVVRPSRQVIEGAGCPGLNGYPAWLSDILSKSRGSRRSRINWTKSTPVALCSPSTSPSVRENTVEPPTESTSGTSSSQSQTVTAGVPNVSETIFVTTAQSSLTSTTEVVHSVKSVHFWR